MELEIKFNQTLCSKGCSNELIMARTEIEIKNEIEQLRALLTGNLFEDGDIQQKIYDLKKELNPRIVEHPEEDDDEGCLNCGS